MNDWSDRLRNLVIAAVVVGCVWAIYVWWQRLPPRSSGSWSNQHCEHSDKLVPHYFVGSFHANDRFPSIGYFVRVTDESRLDDPLPWLVEENGNVFFNGYHVRYRPGTFQLFVADGGEAPRCVILDASDARQFRSNGPFTSFDPCVAFWHDVLQKKYLREPNER